MSEVGYDKSKWIPLDEAEEMLIYDISREYDRIHSVELDGETGHYYPDRARMNPLEDSLGDVEIWVYNETNEEVDDYVVEPHFHVCKGRIEEKGKTFYKIDIEVKIKNIEQLNIWRSVTGNTSWSGLDELYNVIRLWLINKAFDSDITNMEAIRLEWNRNNMSNRVNKDELYSKQSRNMSRSYLHNKWMQKIYAGVGRSFRQSKMKNIGRNPHRLDEVPKNFPSRYIATHCDCFLVSRLQESTSYGGHSIPTGGHRKVSGIVRARVKEEVRRKIDMELYAI